MSSDGYVQGRLLVPRSDRPHEMTLRTGRIRIEGDTIAEVDFEDSIRSGADDVDSADRSVPIIAPGFVDCHLHLPQFDMIGVHGMPLLQWLQQATFPAELRWADRDFAIDMTHRVVDQLVAHGTTAIAAYATNHPASAEAALQVATARGLRGVIGQVLMDRGGPPELLQPASDQIDQTATLLDRYPRHFRMAAAVTPRFAIACTGELMSAAGELASRTDATIQTHLAETLPECEVVADLFGGRSYTDVYRDHGLLTSKTLLGHGIHLDGESLTKIADADAMIAHCPTANAFLISGDMNRVEHQSHGVAMALGSDIGAGFERSMVRVARSMILTATRVGNSFPTPAQAWWQITHGNASCLGLDHYGLIAGGSADLVVIDADAAWQASPNDPLAGLMFAWDDRWIRQVVVRGREVISC